MLQIIQYTHIYIYTHTHTINNIFNLYNIFVLQVQYLSAFYVIKGVLGSILLCLFLGFPSALRIPLSVNNGPHSEPDNTHLIKNNQFFVSFAQTAQKLFVSRLHSFLLRITLMNDSSIRFVVTRSICGSLLILHSALCLLLVLVQLRNVITWQRLHCTVKK